MLRTINELCQETGVPKEELLNMIETDPKLKDIKALMKAGGVNVFLSAYEENTIKFSLLPLEEQAAIEEAKAAVKAAKKAAKEAKAAAAAASAESAPPE